MDFHLKQLRNHHYHHQDSEEEQQPSSAKFPKLLADPPPPPPYQQTAPLSLFIDDGDQPNSKFSNLSAFPDSTTAPRATNRFPMMEGGGGGYFSVAQWQELELQALIYRYMLAGAAIPPELLQSIKKSLLHSPPYFLHHPLQQYYSYYQPALLQTGYWGRAAMDPEPGRCRRTDGKKWRCSRDVVAGQKYCERHVHRGRSRSRKPVEIPTLNSSSTTTNTTTIVNPTRGSGVGGASGTVTSSTTSRMVAGVTTETGFSLSGQSPFPDLLHLNNSSLDSRPETKGLLPQSEAANRSDSHILRHFFDDWPKSSLQEPEGAASPMNSTTCLSISMPGNAPSDVSLKLATGNGGEEEEEPPAGGPRGNGRERHHVNWTVSSMGGPLAEAFRSSTCNASPTSVLHHNLPRASASETSFVTS